MSVASTTQPGQGTANSNQSPPGSAPPPQGRRGTHHLAEDHPLSISPHSALEASVASPLQGGSGPASPRGRQHGQPPFCVACPSVAQQAGSEMAACAPGCVLVAFWNCSVTAIELWGAARGMLCLGFFFYYYFYFIHVQKSKSLVQCCLSWNKKSSDLTFFWLLPPLSRYWKMAFLAKM